VSPDEYRAQLKALGLTPAKPSYNGATLHQNRDGLFASIPDADELLPEERADFIEMLLIYGGYSRSN
jgi:hypothetical protein